MNNVTFTDSKKITVRIQRNWDQDMVYPVCSTAKLFALIAGKKTLTNPVLTAIKALGYTIEIETPTIEGI